MSSKSKRKIAKLMAEFGFVEKKTLLITKHGNKTEEVVKPQWRDMKYSKKLDKFVPTGKILSKSNKDNKLRSAAW